MPVAPLSIKIGNPESSPADAGDVRSGGTVAIETHGCKLNQADSAVLARQFAQAGYHLVDSNADADIIVVNTCTVTATADSKARQALRAARRSNPGALVIAAGCYPQRAAEELRNMPEVSLVVGNQEKPGLASLAIEELTRHNGPSRASPAVGPDSNAGILRRSRAMVKIQEGCDQVCAYCIVPRVRGRERSIPPGDLVENVNRLVAAGFREVALTGTQLGTYGFDLDGANLPRLLARILDETPVSRLRVSSLQAHEISVDLLRLWQDPRLCPHFHVPLQSGCDSTLKAMRRRYDTGQFGDAIASIRENVPGAGITTDMIVGFPGEDGAAHDASIAFAAEIGFADMHVFPYSQRPGTTAHHLPGQVPPDEKRRRAAEMAAVGKTGYERFRDAQIGRTCPVLWETARPTRGSGTREWSGLTDHYVRVKTESDEDLGNTITSARLIRRDGKAMRVVVPG